MFLQRNRFFLFVRPTSRRGWDLGILTLVLLGLASTAPAQSTGSIPVPYDSSVKRIGVAVVSASPELAALLQNAFRIHGAFDLAPASTAQYTLRADLTPGGQVSIAVEPKVMGGTSFTATGSGSAWYEAAYRAGDQVVEKLTTYPGFFAGRLAFVSTRAKALEIFTSDLLGEHVTGWKSGSISIHPCWSPDGSKLLYTSNYRTGFLDLTLLNVSTGLQKAIASYKGTNTGGVISPDGRSIAMILSSTGTPQLYVSDLEGRNVRALTHSASLKSSPTWSPDGKQIILSDDTRGEPLLYLISSSGGPIQPLKTGIPRYSGDAAWNPRDPALVAFMEEQGNQSFIAVYSFKTGTSEIYDALDGSQPCWANDGRHIFFTHHASGLDQVYLLDTVTKKVSRLTTKGASEPAFYYPAK